MTVSAHVTEEPHADDARTLRRAAGPDVRLTFGAGAPPADCVTLVEGVPPPERLDAAAGLTTVIVPWAGLPANARATFRARPHLSIHNLHHNAGPTAEMAMALFLAAAKSIVPRDRELRANDWSQRHRKDLALGLERRRVLVWGCGAVGSRIAAACRALGMDVTGVAREARDGVHGTEELPRLLPDADVLFVCVPLTAETEGRIGAEEIARLPRSAVLVNVARGPVVDENALHGALASGHLFGAGLDVWWRYPKRGETQAAPSTAPFHQLDNVVLSPHRGGHVVETEPLRMRALGATLRAQAEGRPLPWPVDVERGY